MSVREAGVVPLLLLAACSEGPVSPIADPDPGDTVLVVTIEGIDRQRLDMYGAEDAPMSVLSELALEGTVYEGFIPASVGANSSLASLFTGLAPGVHGVGSMRTLGGARLAEDFETVAEEFQREGWRTIAAVSQARLSAEVSGFEQGFDAYDAPPISSGTRPRGSGATADALLDLIHDGVGEEEPLFAWLHLADLDEDRPGEAKWCEPWLHRRFQALAGDGDVAEALARPPGEVFESLRRISVRRRGSEAWSAWNAALHDAALERQDYALGRVLNAMVASGRSDDLRVIVCGVEAGEWKEPTEEGRAPSPSRPGPGLVAPLVVWLRGGGDALRAGGILRGADAKRLLLGEEPPLSKQAWIRDTELIGAVRVGLELSADPIDLRSLEEPDLEEHLQPLAGLTISHPPLRSGALLIQLSSGSGALRGAGDRRGERLRFVTDPGEKTTIITESRHPSLSVQLEGEGVDERAVRLGSAPLEALDVGVLGVGAAQPWPEGDESWLIDLARDPEDPSLTLLRVSAGAGEARLVLEDADDLVLDPAVREGEVSITDHPALLGARVVTGAAPFTLELQGVRPSDLALAAFADGARVPAERMRHMGRRWGGGGKLQWLLSSSAWTALVRPGVLDAGEPDPERIVIDFPYRIPDHRVVRWPGPEARAFAKRLDRNE